jgi:hypothetical protein
MPMVSFYDNAVMKGWENDFLNEGKEQFENRLCKYMTILAKSYDEGIISKETLSEYFIEMSLRCPSESLSYLHNLIAITRKEKDLLTQQEKIQEIEQQIEQQL